MGTWDGDWTLKVAGGKSYDKLAIGDFTLAKITDDTFEVTNVQGNWLGVRFDRSPGTPGPKLGWPLLNAPENAHMKAAGKRVREIVKQQWDASQLQYECLEGEVQTDGGVEKLLLFKSDNGFQNGDDFLVGIRVDDLDDGRLPDGSVSGRRR